jgi:hypothetical protein
LSCSTPTTLQIAIKAPVILELLELADARQTDTEAVRQASNTEANLQVLCQK